MDLVARLQSAGIQASPQRLAVAKVVLTARDHPSAEHVWDKAKGHLPAISRATVYNTLNLFVAKGLLKELVLAEGRAVFDPVIAPHHHFVDVDTGAITDIPWGALQVKGVSALGNFHVTEHQVVLRGKKKRR